MEKEKSTNLPNFIFIIGQNIKSMGNITISNYIFYIKL